jgi:hypothetical protein
MFTTVQCVEQLTVSVAARDQLRSPLRAAIVASGAQTPAACIVSAKIEARERPRDLLRLPSAALLRRQSAIVESLGDRAQRSGYWLLRIRPESQALVRQWCSRSRFAPTRLLGNDLKPAPAIGFRPCGHDLLGKRPLERDPPFFLAGPRKDRGSGWAASTRTGRAAAG